MTPAKAKDLIPGLAKQIGMPEEDLVNMLSFYFKENKRIVTTLEHSHLVLRGLGILNIKRWLLEEKLKEKEVSDPDSVPMFVAAIERDKKERIRKKATGVKKRQFYENKNTNNEPQGDTTNGLEEQGPDNGRVL